MSFALTCWDMVLGYTRLLHRFFPQDDEEEGDYVDIMDEDATNVLEEGVPLDQQAYYIQDETVQADSTLGLDLQLSGEEGKTLIAICCCLAWLFSFDFEVNKLMDEKRCMNTTIGWAQ